MKKYIFYCFFASLGFSSDIYWDYKVIPEPKSEMKLMKKVYSLNGESTISIYRTIASGADSEQVNESEYLKVETPQKVWWISDMYPASMFFDGLEFIDSYRALISYSNMTVSRTYLFDLKTKKAKYVGSGTGHLILVGEEKGLIGFNFEKHYFPAPEYGAYWIDTIRDFDGNLVKILSPSKIHGLKCVKVKTILDGYQEKSFPKLKQNLDECIFPEI